MNIKTLIEQLGLDESILQSGDLAVYSPADGANIANVARDSPDQAVRKIGETAEAFKSWRKVPAPRRGELIRIFGNILREHKEPLGALVSLECGKIYQEGLGEVQEMIDICDAWSKPSALWPYNRI